MMRTRVGIVDADHVILAREEGLLASLCDLASLHLRRFIKGDCV